MNQQLKQKHPELYWTSEVMDRVDTFLSAPLTRKELQGMIEAIIIKMLEEKK